MGFAIFCMIILAILILGHYAKVNTKLRPGAVRRARENAQARNAEDEDIFLDPGRSYEPLNTFNDDNN